MLDKYKKYLNLDIIKEDMDIIKADPPGVAKLYDTKSYSQEFNNIVNEAVARAKKVAIEEIVEKLKKEWMSKIISMSDENGRQKILEVNDIKAENKGLDYYPVFIEDKDRKFRFNWESDSKSRIYDVGRFLEFFEEHYLDKLIMFQGRPIKGGDQMRYVKHVLRIGVHNGTSQDYLIVESDDKTSQLLLHTQPIKIMDQRIKELDPYGEENWDK